MRILFLSFCRCCGFFDEESKDSTETVIKEELPSTTQSNQKDTSIESVFRVKEMRQRSVDYVIHSPRFGGSSLPDCTGGTDSSHKLSILISPSSK